MSFNFQSLKAPLTTAGVHLPEGLVLDGQATGISGGERES